IVDQYSFDCNSVVIEDCVEKVKRKSEKRKSSNGYWLPITHSFIHTLLHHFSEGLNLSANKD
ncbi:hypothetical protein KJ656_00080, partial [bacterium]|nr:hypothetical protein [bacterium]